MQSTEYYSQEIQERDGGGGFETGAINGLAMLTLNNAFTTTTTSTTTEPPLPFSSYSSSSSTKCCTMCGSSVKRQSPSSSSSLQQPTPKKQLNLLTSASSSSAAATKLPPPITPQIASPPSASNSLPILRRCLSDPVNSPGTTNPGDPSTQFLNPQSPDNAKTNVSVTTPSPAKSTTSLPPLPRALRRSVSDPTQSAYHLSTAAAATPQHAPPRTSSQSPISGELGSELIRGESPNSKRLKRMKYRMKEMIQWWEDEVMREGEEDGGYGDSNGNNENTTEDEIAKTETEEAVSVERSGECLIIHFKCPCNKGYQILLSGKNCYYKLM